jgi:hypothetical protein
MYCVYVTAYSGEKLPKYYVGSTSVDKIKNGYRGSVSSKEWGFIWNMELKQNPQLFSTLIISTHDTRSEALEAELDYQIKNNVVISEQWINKSLAQPNGFFGMDVSGENNPMYGKNRTGENHKGGENISKSLQEFFQSDKSDNHRKSSSDRLKINNPTKNPEIIKKMKEIWVKKERNIGPKNGMFGKTGKLLGKKLYNDGNKTKAFVEGEQPEGWVLGRSK